MRNRSLFFIAILLVFVSSACNKSGPVEGCTDNMSLTYSADAEVDNGSCEYADILLPLAIGNTWLLEDEITVPFIGTIPISATFTVVKDTVMNGKSYYIMNQSVGSSTFGAQELRNAYRFDYQSGIMYTVALDTVGRPEGTFFTYPLDLGASWNAGAAGSDPINASIVGYGIEDVPAGTFTNVYEVQYDATGAEAVDFTGFFAKDIGYVKATIIVDAMGTEILIQPELVSYTLFD